MARDGAVSAQGESVRKIVLLAVLLGAAASIVNPSRGPQAAAATASPIQHIVILDQENHSFDNVLGKFCAQVASGAITRAGLNDICDGTTTGTLHTGQTIPLPTANDITPDIPHSVASHATAINNGAMNGFDLLNHCSSADGYACYQQFGPSQSPNLTLLAKQFGVGDRFFEFRWFSSWMSHTTLASLDMNGFQGNIPKGGTKQGPGWGCDSGLTAKWLAPGATRFVAQPSCIPDTSGSLGPLWPAGSQVPYVPTIMDRMRDAGLSWMIYSAGGPSGAGAYGWSICPTFYQCLGHADENTHWKKAANFISDAQAGTLPAVSIVTPIGYNSQHNTTSWTTGDNWIGSMVQAMEDGGEWSSTTMFITNDDCGCFYDHVAPPSPDLGIRLPLIIAGPYVKAGYTESTTTTWANVAAYIEATFPAVQPINSQDAGAYAFSNAVNYSQTPRPPPVMKVTPLTPRSRAYVKAHPYTGEDDAT
jgi:phospholipase C